MADTSQDLQVLTNTEQTLVRQAPSEISAKDPLKINDRKKSRCMAQVLIAEMYQRYIQGAGHGASGKKKKEFVDLYNLGKGGPCPDLYEKVNKIKRFKTIDEWIKILAENNGDCFALADERGVHRKGQTTITPEQKTILNSTIFAPNSPNVEQAIRMSRIRMGDLGISAPQHDRTFRNYYKELERTRYDEWKFFREGEKARKEACEPSIIRDWDPIKSGQVWFADGHTWNVETLNPETGRPKRHHFIHWYDGKSNLSLGGEISASENTQSIAIALYRAILFTGKLPEVVYLDNGKAFRSKFFSGVEDFRQESFVGVFKQLGIHVVFANPYNARAKTIERFHKTLDEFERRTFSFVGSSINDKPARLKRAETFHKQRYDNYMQGRMLTNEQLYYAFTKWHYDEYAHRPQRGHLCGKTPWEVFEPDRGPGFSAEEKDRLNMLLAARAVRRIARDGIRLPGSDVRYYHADLYGRQLQSAIVRYDWLDRSRIYVYDCSGAFICVAEPRKKIHPTAALSGSPENVDNLKAEIAQQRSLAKRTTDPARETFKNDILPELRFQQSNLGLTGIQPPSLESYKHIESSTGPGEVEAEQPLSAELRAQIAEGVEELARLTDEQKAPSWETVKTQPDALRYAKNIRRQIAGQDLPQSEKTWMFWYEGTSEFAAYRADFDELQLQAALNH